jgi:hypothetical protein
MSNTFQQFRCIEQKKISNAKQCIKRQKLLGRIKAAETHLKQGAGGSSNDLNFAATIELQNAKSELKQLECEQTGQRESMLAFYSHAAKIIRPSSKPRDFSHEEDDDVSIAGKKRSRIVSFSVENGPDTKKGNPNALMTQTTKSESDTTQILHRILNKDNYSMVVSNNDPAAQKTQLMQQSLCQWCGNTDRVINHDTSYIQCNVCGVKERFCDSGINSFPFGTDYDASTQGYQRKSHLGGIFRKQLTGSQTPLDEHQMEKLKKYIKDQNLEISHLNLEDIKTILECNGLSDMVESSVNILCTLKGVTHPGHDPERLHMLEHCFLKAEETFVNYARNIVGRNNFTYYPTIRLLAILLGYDDIVSLFPPLKTPEKRAKASELLKIIWEKNGWEFFGTDVTTRSFVS